METDLTLIIRQKAHEASVKSLIKNRINENLIDKLTYEFLESIATELSGILRETFIYTGKIIVGEGYISVSYTSSSKSDEVIMKISFNHKEDEPFEFEGLNDKLEKLVDDKEKQPKKEVKPKPVKQKIKKIEKPKIKLNPEQMLKSLNDQVEKEEKEKKKTESDKVTKLMFKAIEKLEIKDEVNKKVELLNKIINKEKSE
jgi:hypothetical protein